MIKPLDLALLVIDKKACAFHPSFYLEDSTADVFENYKALCEANGHDVASSELGAFDGKE